MRVEVVRGIRRKFVRLAAGLLALALASIGLIVGFSSPAAAATVNRTICSKNGDYFYNILGGNADSLRAKLTNADNFGPSGAYGDYSFAFKDVGTTVSEAILIAQSCDIYFSGFEADYTYTSTELQELRKWTQDDSTRQVVAGCDSSDFDPVCDALGFTVTTDTDTYGFISGLDVNPVNCDRTLDFTDQINMAGGVGAYFSGPDVTTRNTVAVHETNGAADTSKPIIVYTGNFLLTSDINMIESGGTEETVTDGPGVTSNNDIVVMNAFSALSDASVGKAICDSAAPPSTTTPSPTATTTTSAAATPTVTITATVTATSTPSSTASTMSATPSQTSNDPTSTGVAASDGSANASSDSSEVAGTTNQSSDTGAASDRLGSTGINAGAIAAIGAAMIVAGCALLLFRRRPGSHA